MANSTIAVKLLQKTPYLGNDKRDGKAHCQGNRAQVEHNAAALVGEIPAFVFERMTAVSDNVIAIMPDTGNMYRYYP